MPSMANITVKNAANADVVYNAATPSAGDKTPAVWRQNLASGVIAYRPELMVLTRSNSNVAKPSRIVDITFKLPVLETVSGVVTQTAIVPGSFNMAIPTNVDSALVKEAYVQFGNLLVSALLRSVMEEGYAPT